MTRHPAFWPTFFAVPAFLVLLGLGTWQVERLHWKEGLIAQRSAAVNAPAIDLPKTLGEAKPLEFRHVRAAGTFLHDKELFIGATADNGTVGYHVMTPLRRADGSVLLVNRGFVPAEMKDPGGRARAAALLCRCRADAQSGRLAARRHDLARSAQQPSPICDHLVRHRRRACRGLCPFHQATDRRA